MNSLPEIAVDAGTDDELEQPCSPAPPHSVSGSILIASEPHPDIDKRHVSFDDGNVTSERREKERKDKERRRSGWGGFEERLSSRWGRSPSPVSRKSSVASNSSIPDNQGERSEEGKKWHRRRGLSPAVRRRSGDEDSELSARLDRTSISNKSRHDRDDSRNRSPFFGGKKFNPEDPETEDERRTRRHLKTVTGFISQQRIGMMTSRNIKGWLVSSAIAIAEMVRIPIN